MSKYEVRNGGSTGWYVVLQKWSGGLGPKWLGRDGKVYDESLPYYERDSKLFWPTEAEARAAVAEYRFNEATKRLEALEERVERLGLRADAQHNLFRELDDRLLKFENKAVVPRAGARISQLEGQVGGHATRLDRLEKMASVPGSGNTPRVATTIVDLGRELHAMRLDINSLLEDAGLA